MEPSLLIIIIIMKQHILYKCKRIILDTQLKRTICTPQTSAKIGKNIFAICTSNKWFGSNQSATGIILIVFDPRF